MAGPTGGGFLDLGERSVADRPALGATRVQQIGGVPIGLRSDGTLLPLGSAQVPRDWLDAHRLFALSLGCTLGSRWLFTDFYTTSTNVSDGSWACSSANFGIPGSHPGGAVIIGGVAESVKLTIAGQSGSSNTLIQSLRHSPWYACARSSLYTLAAQTSRQALVTCATAALATFVCIGYLRASSTTNLSMWTELGGVVGTSIALPELVQQSIDPQKDYSLFYDGFTVRGFSGDPWYGTPMSLLGEIIDIRDLQDAPATPAGYSTVLGGDANAIVDYASLGGTTVVTR